MPKQCETKQPTTVVLRISPKLFLLICSEITGYSGFELESTGLVDTYYQLLPRIFGPQLTEEFAETIDDLLITDSIPRRDRDRRPSIEFWAAIATLACNLRLGFALVPTSLESIAGYLVCCCGFGPGW